MDRFSEELFGIRRYETFASDDEPEIEEEYRGCNHDNVSEEQGQHCSSFTCMDCGETWESDESPSEVVNSLKRALAAYDAWCAACGSTRKTVQSDRLYVNSFAVCCDQKEIA